MIASLYAYLLPLGVLISAASIIIFYWCQKYQVLRRHSIPYPLTENLTLEMCDSYLFLTVLLYSVGCFSFELIIHKTVTVQCIIQLIISIYTYLFRLSRFLKCCSWVSKYEKVVENY